MANQRIQIKRGLHTNLPNTGMLEGEPMITTDRLNLHAATDSTTRKTVTPAVDLLDTLAVPNTAADLVMIHDADATGQKEKKLTIAALKTAMNIPESDSDEKVAVVSGGVSGYPWGTDGTDGIFRMGSSMQWTKDSGNAYVTLEVAVIDGGTF